MGTIYERHLCAPFYDSHLQRTTYGSAPFTGGCHLFTGAIYEFTAQKIYSNLKIITIYLKHAKIQKDKVHLSKNMYLSDFHKDMYDNLLTK
jgi:hypothetical protein